MSSETWFPLSGTDEALDASGRYPDETRLAGSEHLDPEFAARYDRKAGDAAGEDAARLPRLVLSNGATSWTWVPGRAHPRLEAAILRYGVIAVEVRRHAARGGPQKRTLTASSSFTRAC